MPRQIQGSQHDFSAGEIDIDLKRCDDHPARKAGLRQMSNMRIHNSNTIQNRSGRSALFPAGTATRIEKITMSPSNDFSMVFGPGYLKIVNGNGAQAALFSFEGNGLPLPWNLGTLRQVSYCQIGLSIYLAYPGMRPQVVSWDGVSTWSIADFNELVVGTGQKRTFFYRISPQNVTLLPGSQSGSGISLNASANIFLPGHVGTRMRYVGRQMLITAVSSPTLATVTIMETLPGSQSLTFTIDPRATFSIGDVVLGSVTGAQAIIIATNSTQIVVQLLSNREVAITNQLGQTEIFAFTNADTVVGPGGGILCNSATVIGAPLQVTVWDEEVMNSLQGYPAHVFADQFRLGFANFPTIPGAIGWSAINSPTDLYVIGATQPNGAIMEVAPDKVQIYFVVPGPESSEFVFCDKRLYYIKIDASNPLRPGSVGFQMLSGDGCAAYVQPRISQDLILYVNAGLSSVMAITAPGAYYRPFATINLCDFHSHLFNNIFAIAVPTADGQFNERYAYILNGDGSVVVGRYALKDGQLASVVGWGPWSGAGMVTWIAGFGGDVIFTTTYFGTFSMCEKLDDSRYLDGAVTVNSLPAAMAPSAGLGPLWWAASQSVSLMDQVTRSMGVYQIDINGNIIPQNNGGENLLSTSLVAGLAWTAIVEPFAPDAQSGADVGQRMRSRQIANFAAYVINSTGFLFATLFSAKQTRTSPALGTVVTSRRVTAYNMDDDATLPPTQRETVEMYPSTGSSYDPRVAIIKDTPGPLLIAEIGIEVSI